MRIKLVCLLTIFSVALPLSAFSADTLKQQYIDARYVEITNYTGKILIDLKDVSTFLRDGGGTFAVSQGLGPEYHGAWWVILKNGMKIYCNSTAPGCNAEEKWNTYKTFLKDHPEFLNVP